MAIYPQLPPGAERDNATELADKLLVGSAVDDRGLVIFVFLVVGCPLASFIIFVSHPRGDSGADAWARW